MPGLRQLIPRPVRTALPHPGRVSIAARSTDACPFNCAVAVSSFAACWLTALFSTLNVVPIPLPKPDLIHKHGIARLMLPATVATTQNAYRTGLHSTAKPVCGQRRDGGRARVV